MSRQAKKWKTLWLLGFLILTLSMISVGGVTRLTRSGLSIVEWRPVSGIIPPLSEEEWQRQFEMYKASPEYQQLNSHFEIADYKKIFFWEYLHRVLGRLIFLYVLIPGLILWRKKLVEGQIVSTLALLVAAQGLIGWLMVMSGLNIRPHVSPYMLALHFFSALVVLLTAKYYLIKAQDLKPIILPTKIRSLFKVFGYLLALQIFYGCLTSGLKAGFSFNTYPLMGGRFLPATAFELNPVWLNIFENTGMVQWIHRWLGILTLLTLIFVIFKLLRTSSWKNHRGPFFHLFGIIVVQIILGILNIIFVVPVWLGAVHQLMAAFLVLAYFAIQFRIKNEAKI